MRILAGDVGGTKTFLSLYERSNDGELHELKSAKFDSSSFHGLSPMVHLFAGREAPQVEAAAFGVAGPVVNDTCRATNLPWSIDARSMEVDLGIPKIRLINDFHAVALGVYELGRDDVAIVQDRAIADDAPVAVIGAGTGLGEAVVLKTGGRIRVMDSEGGHTDFAPRNEVEIELLRYLLRRHHRVSYERVLSGPGLVTLYEFVVEQGLARESGAVREQMIVSDPPAVIGEAALSGRDAACLKAVELFVSLYGAEAGNLALKVLPRGGVFIAGGIAPKLLPKILEGEFLRAFCDKGRMSVLLETMRVVVVKNTRVGLLGARTAAIELLDR